MIKQIDERTDKWAKRKMNKQKDEQTDRRTNR